MFIGNSIFNAIGGKFYHYLALNKPLLAYTKKGSQLDLEITNYNLGFVCYSKSELNEAFQNILLDKSILIKKKNVLENILKILIGRYCLKNMKKY